MKFRNELMQNAVTKSQPIIWFNAGDCFQNCAEPINLLEVCVTKMITLNVGLFMSV